MDRIGILETLEAIARRAKVASEPGTEYLAPDGLKHCTICGGKRETWVTPPLEGAKPMKVSCWCKCPTQYDVLKEKEKLDGIERERGICFRGFEMQQKHTFDLDDHTGDAQIVQACKRYAEDFRDNQRRGMGLLLYGTVGTGKTFLAACIANAILDQGYRVRMTNFTTIADELWNAEDKASYIDDMCRFDLLVLDDLGTERKTEYMDEMVYKIVNARYVVGKPMVVTTNLSSAELSQTKDISKQRIYDRLIERCLPIQISGKSRRRAAASDAWAEMRQKLGLEAKNG